MDTEKNLDIPSRFRVFYQFINLSLESLIKILAFLNKKLDYLKLSTMRILHLSISRISIVKIDIANSYCKNSRMLICINNSFALNKSLSISSVTAVVFFSRRKQTRRN